MLNTLLEFPTVFLPQASLIWHHVFMFFLPPPPPSFTPPLFPKLVSLISPLFYTYTHLLPPLLHPSLPPIVSQPLPPYLHFCFVVHFMAIPLLPPTIWFPPPSLWIAHPIPLPLPVPLTPHFRFFIILWSRSTTVVQLYHNDSDSFPKLYLWHMEWFFQTIKIIVVWWDHFLQQENGPSRLYLWLRKWFFQTI